MKRYSTACERNRDPILDVLRRVLPDTGRVLEISAGTGMHSAWWAPRLPGLDWQPTDRDAEALASIAAWRDEVAAPNLRAPVVLDTQAADWPVEAIDAAICCNMIHISPWESTLGLFAGLERVLVPGGVFVLYGPFRFGGVWTSPSNAQFDRSLKSRDPSWGVRDRVDVVALAARHGQSLQECVELPANNHVLVFRQGAGSSNIG